MNELAGKVAFITGVARGQGRAHALRLAGAGAAIIGIDICADIESMNIPCATVDDLATTKSMVEEAGGRIILEQADVRDFAAVDRALQAGIAEFGRLDIVVANAGIVRLGSEVDPLAEWRDIIDVNLTGVFHTIHAAVPIISAGGRGGSIVLIGSTAALRGTHSAVAGGLAYTASKRALDGVAQVLARHLGPQSIRVNVVHPTGVATKLLLNTAMRELFESRDPAVASMSNALPIGMLAPEDIADAVAWLVSDGAKYITGISMPVDAGFAAN